MSASMQALRAQQSDHLQRQYTDLLEVKVRAAAGGTSGAPAAVKGLLRSMLARLMADHREREAEVALYNSMLFELERNVEEGVVRRAALEARVEGYERELAERDRLDASMDVLVANMTKRIAELEAAERDHGMGKS